MNEELEGIFDEENVETIEMLSEEELEEDGGAYSVTYRTKSSSMMFNGRNWTNIQWLRRDGATISISNTKGTLTVRRGGGKTGLVAFKVGSFKTGDGQTWKNFTFRVYFENTGVINV